MFPGRRTGTKCLNGPQRHKNPLQGLQAGFSPRRWKSELVSYPSFQTVSPKFVVSWGAIVPPLGAVPQCTQTRGTQCD